MTFRTGYSTHNRVYGTKVSDSLDCPVCGTENSNCIGPEGPIVIALENIAPDDKVMIRVKEDVVRETKVSETKSITEVVAKAGSYISKAQAIELGLLP
jgi:hypothetical protein